MLLVTKIYIAVQQAPSEAYDLYQNQHQLFTRWAHWVNFPILFIMIWSGLLIQWTEKGMTIMRRCKTRVVSSLIPLLVLLLPAFALAQKQEVGLTLGALASVDRISTTNIAFHVGSGIALQANYEYRILNAGPAVLYVGVHFLASPQRSITSQSGSLTRDIASLYITPDLMVKLFPHGRLIPWGTIGGGYGDYEQSTTVLSGALNGAPRELSRGVLMYGGGIDVPIWRFVTLRGEVRDFYTGNAAYNVALSSGQHNVTAGGGIVLRFGGQ